MINTSLTDKISVNTLHSVFAAKNYVIFSNDVKNYNLNIFGVRSSKLDTNTFNDIVGMFWKFQGQWFLKKYIATTDPGLYYFEHPMSVKGTHIMKEGQYRRAYSIGKHQGKYDALVQTGPVDFYKDGDKDRQFDRDENNVLKGGYIGANIHSTINGVIDVRTAKFNPIQESAVVHNWSAACQVLAKPSEYQEFMLTCYKAKDIHGNGFTYTLLNEADFK